MFFCVQGGSAKRVPVQLTLPQQGFVSQAVGLDVALACSMDIILSKFAALEAEWLLRRAVATNLLDIS